MAAALRITVIHGSLLDADVEAIVNAANSLGFMGGGVAGVIKRLPVKWSRTRRAARGPFRSAERR